MKKKGVLSCLLTLGVVSSVMALTGCDFGNPKDSTPGGHVHSYETWTVLPSCQELGDIEHLCACGDNGSRQTLEQPQGSRKDTDQRVPGGDIQPHHSVEPPDSGPQESPDPGDSDLHR